MRSKDRTNGSTNCRALLLVAALCGLLATTAQAGPITVGGGGNATVGEGVADTAASIVVIGNSQVVTDTGGTYNLPASTFNLTDKSTGESVTPFIALYTGGVGGEHDAANYDVVAIGDAYTSSNAGVGVVVPFQAAAGTLTTNAGDIVVGGIFNTALGVVGWDGGGAEGDERIIMQGTASVATDLAVTDNDWSGNAAVNNRTHYYDISLTPVPEPSTCVLVILGAIGLIGVVPRRR